jgi:hypothetical protein
MRQKQFNSLQRLTLRPEDWCDILGVRILDPDGWRQKKKDYTEFVSLHEFVELARPSTMSFEDGATDFFDVENYLAEGEWKQTQ